MKRIIQGLVLAALISTAQASPFPTSGDDSVGPSPEWTYADRHAGDGNMQLDSAFPGNGDDVSLPSESTYADRFVIERTHYAESAIPTGAPD